MFQGIKANIVVNKKRNWKKSNQSLTVFLLNGTQTPKTDPFTPTIGIATTTTALASLWGQKKNTCFVKAKKGKKGKVLFSVTES